ncbi:hypothetical protein A3J43_01900 [Candidatus Uhrbacteria bacterium RIFCSPHIGHO2_12_FULL_54_23]|uniref:Transcription elongation factor GreA n=3 Tax=Candidatus Uhriibacteriota TaxID=1752732 RepID=A0A1F7UIT6_9BACT|nr:MAG: hypothetical protein A3J43_01900 [Candidatus Uhrbacteria bacterium RIFCSPHIGHO2_12_FULL_54_23]OGL83591.1 MAG: hypothetical protein A3B36_00965 [Candidatus Uhrbacteria bacterium RIFCSPLOWO2_01_FULL_55_36]OGL89944.1 MAG: hypothetical protein A3J36_00705 [Candidatus Uhrbacteria bacterium RIFCSPLOWO2_02_FULL_54_37]
MYLTQAGIDKLSKQLERCERELPDLIAEVQRTGAYGDFSENAEYQAAKYLMRRMHGRIASLKDRLNRAQLITAVAASADTVQIGSTVVVEIGGKQCEYQILGSYESDPARGRISHASPLGAALLHRRRGETVDVDTPRGRLQYRVMALR